MKSSSSLKEEWIVAEQEALNINLSYMAARAKADAAKERYRKAERDEQLKDENK